MLLGCKVLLFDPDGNLLLLKRTDDAPYDPGVYCLPGGHIDPGEEPEAAALRECEEEIGYRPELRLRKLIIVPANLCAGKPHPPFPVWVYEATVRVSRGDITLAPEHAGLGWFPPDNLPPLNAFTQLILA